MSVELKISGSTAIVTLDNSPVNAIGRDVREGLLEAFRKIKGMAEIERVILTGTDKTFSAGADAREFGSPPVEPHLPQIIAAIEGCGKPVIAAISGPALGGGYELALACRYRIASKKSILGLPEVTLGVVPGSGGTQRLPRLVGMAKAVELISQGKTVKSNEALTLGMIDQIADSPVEIAKAIDLGLVVQKPILSEIGKIDRNNDAIKKARNHADKRMRGQIAPQKAIDLVEMSSELDIDEALEKERETFLELRASTQANALRHIFFAERTAKMPEYLGDADAVQINQAVIIGGGTMGASIAYAMQSAGIRVSIIETDEMARARALDNVGKLFDAAVKRGLMDEQTAKERATDLKVLVGYDDIPPADIAIEAAFENMEVKKEIFKTLNDVLPAHAILATNTSYLNINEIALSIPESSRVLGLHFFSPAHIMKLLEIVRGDQSSPEALATGFTLAKRLRKIPVLAGVCDGFIGNRILARYREIADIILIDGSTPAEIDQAMVEFGYPMGPYMAQDLSGLDIAFANRQRLAATRDSNRRYVKIADRMVNEGRIGKKVGMGWYQYSEDMKPAEAPTVEDLIVEEAGLAGVVRREFTAGEIRDRLLSAVINEALAILDEGIAISAADIDLVLVHGYGFPRWRGGPLHYAQSIGFDQVLNNIENYEKEDPIIWSPSPLLKRFVNEGIKAFE